MHLEKGDYGAAVKDCDAAVERGRELRADFKLIAKALARKGAALAKAGDLPAAVEAYQKSLTEHRCGLPSCAGRRRLACAKGEKLPNLLLMILRVCGAGLCPQVTIFPDIICLCADSGLVS